MQEPTDTVGSGAGAAGAGFAFGVVVGGVVGGLVGGVVGGGDRRPGRLIEIGGRVIADPVDPV